MLHVFGQIQQMAELRSGQVGVTQVKEVEAEHLRAVTAQHLDENGGEI
jgi:hypothetical protein